ncbi:U3 small nucleolar RNA-associated protein 4-like protein [Psilocybe cubensis]|uniref:U3 small nucleolar RNA-associated protein 4 n=2 Tax=Psilocybe cubensis TaxID=181762 RepID=A0A8H8CQZ5_PSICU|nr:U3 small nucleolar RNA-associated protein 4-like protein [Psilocybe cubensis]KAH9487140.1 U3 small nucleolar RNA-associated protein 4-like protein [Psilocybe cubensis]
MDKRKETTTLSVHRCRFVDYAPSAITALAYPPLPLPSVKGKKKTTAGKQPLRFGLLAVGHANGNIDICEWQGAERESQCSQAWVVRKTLPGPYPSKVDSLAFVVRYPEDVGPDDVPMQSDLRLFSSGGGSELIEWDLERGCIRRTINSQGGSIWSIAANPSSSSLALGCEDGTVRILSIANDTLTHSRRFDRVKCRMLSIAWGPPIPRQRQAKKAQEFDGDSSSDDDEEDDWTDSWLVTGCSDSSLRKWDISTGRVIERMGVDKVRGERTLVWTVGVLGDGTIISGDSLGMVKFWDSRTCTQLSSFKAHGADVLCMAVSPEGRAIYTAGVDQKTVQFSLVKTSSTENGPTTSRWTQTCSRRMHSHDVRALAMWPPYTPLPTAYKRHFSIDVAPILASGGLDMSVVLTPAALPTSTVVKITNPLDTSTESTFEDSYHRKLAFVARGVVRVARSTRLVSCAREAGITVWRIHKKPEEGTGVVQMQSGPTDDPLETEPYAGGWEKVLEMDLKVNTNITTHEISDDGRWLIVSDLYESKLFALTTDDKGEIGLKRIKEFSSILQAYIPASPSHAISTGASAFQFTPDSSKLIMSTALSSYVLVINLIGDKPRVMRRFDQHRLRDSIVHDRVVKGRTLALDSAEKKLVNGHTHVNGDASMDVDMAEPDVESPPPANEASEASDDEDDDQDVSSTSATVSVDRIAVSTDGQWLATTDSRARTHIFNLDLISHHCVLPTFPRSAQALAFDPMHPSVLLLSFPDNSIQIFDVETRQFPVWGKELAASLPKRFTHAHDPVLGVSFDPAVTSSSGIDEQGKTRYVLFWGATWMFKVSLDTTVRSGAKKRRREIAPVPGAEEERQWRDYKMITQYRPLLCCDFLAKDELVVVERPLVDVLLTLPPAYFKHKYGAS